MHTRSQPFGHEYTFNDLVPWNRLVSDEKTVLVCGAV